MSAMKPTVMDVFNFNIQQSDDAEILEINELRISGEDLNRRSRTVSECSSRESSLSSSLKVTKKNKRKSNGKVPVLHFLKRLLDKGTETESIIKWEDQARGKFKIVDPPHLLHLWNGSKDRPSKCWNHFAYVLFLCM